MKVMRTVIAVSAALLTSGAFAQGINLTGPWQCVAVCGSVWQCVAVCGSVCGMSLSLLK